MQEQLVMQYSKQTKFHTLSSGNLWKKGKKDRENQRTRKSAFSICLIELTGTFPPDTSMILQPKQDHKNDSNTRRASIEGKIS